MSVEARINEIVTTYDVPVTVLMDIDKRLSDCNDPAYEAQQLRYLENLISYGVISKKGDKG